MLRKFIILAIFTFVLTGRDGLAQSPGINSLYETEIETFMGMLDGVFSDTLIDEITYCLPDKLMIYNYAVGDFSGDTLPDIIISYKDKSCPKNALKVIFLINNKNSFITASEQIFRWNNNPLDISFIIKNHTCYISHRYKEKWVFSSFTFKNNILKQISEEKY